MIWHYKTASHHVFELLLLGQWGNRITLTLCCCSSRLPSNIRLSLWQLVAVREESQITAKVKVTTGLCVCDQVCQQKSGTAALPALVKIGSQIAQVTSPNSCNHFELECDSLILKQYTIHQSRQCKKKKRKNIKRIFFWMSPNCARPGKRTPPPPHHFPMQDCQRLFKQARLWLLNKYSFEVSTCYPCKSCFCSLFQT